LVAFEPDVIFVQFAIAALNVNIWTVRSLCRKFKTAGIPVVVAYHEPAREFDLLGPATRFVYRAMARVTSVPVVYSWAGRQTLVERGLFKEVVEVPLGTAGLATISDEDLRRVRIRYHVAKPAVLVLGFTHFDKGTDLLLDAAADIAERRHHDVQFIIAGSPRKRRGVFRIMGRRDIRCQRRLESQAKKIAGVGIEFFGFVKSEDVAALLYVADIVALPYRRITQSGVASLALSSRAVMVASDLPGLRSDLGDAATYVEVGDSRAMAEQIAQLLDESSDSLRAHMRSLAGERAVSNTLEVVAEAILLAALNARGARSEY
jgi:glycosyltransferase involved in cell wall biosynthesis